MLRHLVNLLLWLLPPSRCFGLRRALLRLAGIGVGAGVSICGPSWFYGRGEVRIGAGSWLSPGARLYSHQDAPIEIGERCDIGHELCIVTGSHELGPESRRAGAGTAAPVRIGDGCWIGAKTLILGGSTIGPGAIVAAGSVVTGDIPANVLAAGVPAVVKKQLG